MSRLTRAHICDTVHAFCPNTLLSIFILPTRRSLYYFAYLSMCVYCCWCSYHVCMSIPFCASGFLFIFYYFLFYFGYDIAAYCCKNKPVISSDPGLPSLAFLNKQANKWKKLMQALTRIRTGLLKYCNIVDSNISIIVCASRSFEDDFVIIYRRYVDSCLEPMITLVFTQNPARSELVTFRILKLTAVDRSFRLNFDTQRSFFRTFGANSSATEANLSSLLKPTVNIKHGVFIKKKKSKRPVL